MHNSNTTTNAFQGQLQVRMHRAWVLGQRLEQIVKDDDIMSELRLVLQFRPPSFVSAVQKVSCKICFQKISYPSSECASVHYSANIFILPSASRIHFITRTRTVHYCQFAVCYYYRGFFIVLLVLLVIKILFRFCIDETLLINEKKIGKSTNHLDASDGWILCIF